jgi:hypothetical protein
MSTKTKLVAAGALGALILAAGGVLAADPPHAVHAAAAEADPVVANIHNQMMTLAMQLAHGAELADVKPKMVELVAHYADHSGEDREALQAHVDQLARHIVAAREEGPETLHAVMMELFGGQTH